jgi:MFS family permease
MLSKLVFGWLMDRFAHRLVYGFAVLGMSTGFILAITVSSMFIVLVVAFFGFFAGSLLPLRGAVVLSQFGAADPARHAGVCAAE